jgi:hypothetical protein
LGGFRISHAVPAADRVSSTITWAAWGLAAAFCGFVAPFAFSSPYPTPSRPDWTLDQKPSPVAQAATFSLASASATPVVAEEPEYVSLVNTVRTVSIRRPIGDAPEPEADREIVTASLGGLPTRDSVEEPKPEPRKRNPAEDVDDYLWEVYQRQPVKQDRGGDFTWKDPAAAKRVGKTLQSYVIVGMDADFREQLYHAGKAMDAAGIQWHIVSGFRDDWRQSIASGIKARTGYSRHGGSRAVGGYGNGRAVDIGHVDKERNDDVWRWVDKNGSKFGLHRPYRFDPPHVEPRVDYRRIASRLRRERTGDTTIAETRPTPEETRPARSRNSRVARANGRTARSRKR